jgi:hypothetical protein
MGRRTQKEPASKFHRHEKSVTLRMDIPLDLMRETAAGDIVAQLAKRRIEEFRTREGLHGRGQGDRSNEGVKASN